MSETSQKHVFKSPLRSSAGAVALGFTAMTTAWPALACWGPTCGDVFHPDDKWDVKAPALGDIKNSVVAGTAVALASQSAGWTLDSCKTTWSAVVLGAIALESETICGGAGAGVCAAAGGAAALGTGLVDAVCIQLCNDHHLQDCQ